MTTRREVEAMEKLAQSEERLAVAHEKMFETLGRALNLPKKRNTTAKLPPVLPKKGESHKTK